MNDLGLISVVALERMAYLDADRFALALRAHLPGQRVQVFDGRHDAHESGIIVVLEGHDCAVVAMDGRLPEPEFSGALAPNPLWPGAAQTMDRHQAFVIITSIRAPRECGDAAAQAAVHTRLAAVLCQSLPTLGAYLPGASGAVPPQRVRQAVGDLNQNLWPADLWIGYEFRGQDTDGGLYLGIRSRGAAPFIGVELEVSPRHVRDREEIIRYLFRALGDLLTRGRKIRDGEPVRMGEGREIWHQARYVRHGDPPIVALRELEEPIWGLANVST